MHALISIIIPTFNSSKHLNETLTSVLAQSCVNWECILVDDGSTDATEAISKNFKEKDPRFKSFKRPENLPKGPSSARNYGIVKAQGEYVIFLDSDDVMSSNCLQSRLFFASKHHNFDWWIFKMNTFQITPNANGELFNSLPNNADEILFYQNELYSGKFPFTVTCPLWKKNNLIALEGFDESMRMLEDPDLHLRALTSGLKCKTAINLEADSYYRVTDDIERDTKKKYYSSIAATSNIYFLKKHFKYNNSAVLYNFKRIYNLYVFPSKSFSSNRVMIKFGLKKNILPMKQIILSCVILTYGKLGAENLKGSGYSLLRKTFNKF